MAKIFSFQESMNASRLTTVILVSVCGVVSACEFIVSTEDTGSGGVPSTSGGASSLSGSAGAAGGFSATTASGGLSASNSSTGGASACAGLGGSPPADAGAETSVIERSTLAYDLAPVVSANAQSALVTDLNDFGVKIFQDLAPATSNFAVSPISGFLALTMTADGAQGATADEIKAVLYPDVSLNEVQAATNQLEQRVRGYVRAPVQTSDGEKKIELNLANDVFVQAGMAIKQPFLDNLAVNYNAGIEQVNFTTDPDGVRNIINNWVANETQCLIQNLIPSGALDQRTRLVLVNALYMYAAWQADFNPQYTQPGTFYGISGNTSTDFMQGTLSVNFAAGTGWQAVDISYYGGSLVLTAILPNAGQFGTVKSNLSAAWLSNFDAVAQPMAMGVILPKFKLSGNSVSWLSALEDLGINQLFDEAECDLSGVTQDTVLYVNNVLQQVYIDVSEQGTEAAAATAVIEYSIDIAGAGSPPPVITFDRPFLLFVRERSGPVLFAGQVVSLPGN